MKRILILLLTTLFVIGCATQRYTSYNNVSVFDNTYGENVYYNNVHVKSYEQNDSLTTVTFVDSNNHLHVVYGKTIIVETILVEKYNYNRYDYYTSKSYIIHQPPYHRYSPRYYSTPPVRSHHYRPVHPKPQPNHRPNNYSKPTHPKPQPGHSPSTPRPHNNGGRRR